MRLSGCLAFWVLFSWVVGGCLGGSRVCVCLSFRVGGLSGSLGWVFGYFKLLFFIITIVYLLRRGVRAP